MGFGIKSKGQRFWRSPMLFSESFIVLHFSLWFIPILYMEWGLDQHQKKVFVFAYECPIAPAPFVEKAISFSSSEFFFLYYCQKNQLGIFCRGQNIFFMEGND